MAPTFDDPTAVAAEAAALQTPPLIAFDVDGVLAPIVAHAADAALSPGVLDLLIALAERVPVAIVSGRSVGDLARFGFPSSLMVSGSHGAERRGMALAPLSAVEESRLDRLTGLAEQAAADAGGGAWVEHKPTGVVLHVREADDARAEGAAGRLVERAKLVAGAQVKGGHGVVELTARRASKATAVEALSEEAGAASIVYTGDDATDEDVFAMLGAGDLGIRVGNGETAARRRLRGPAEVVVLLEQLVSCFKRPAR